MDYSLQKYNDDISFGCQQDALEALYADNIYLPPMDWYNWELNGSEEVRSPNRHCSTSVEFSLEEFGIDRKCVAQVSKGQPVDQSGGSSSIDHREISFDCSARASEASSSGQTDNQLQNSMDWMNGIFLNSLMEDDSSDLDNPLGSLNMPGLTYNSPSSENLLADMLTYPQSRNDSAARETPISTCSFPMFTNDIAEMADDSQPSFFMPKEPDRSEGSATVRNLSEFLTGDGVCNGSEGVADVDEIKCFEATVLQELEDITSLLSESTKVCFRDALQYLALNSKEQCPGANSTGGASFMDINSESQSARSGHTEYKTSVIYRTIGNLMYDTPCYVSPNIPCKASFCSSMENFASPGGFYSIEKPVQTCYYQGHPGHLARPI